MSSGRSADRVSATGADESGLGRWCWFPCCSKDNVRTRMVTAYQPCKTNDASQRFATCRQHRRFFQGKGDNICPRKAFVRDLGKELRRWQNEGDRIAIMMDANEDVCAAAKPVAQLLADLQMKDLIAERHPRLRGTPSFTEAIVMGANRQMHLLLLRTHTLQHAGGYLFIAVRETI